MTWYERYETGKILPAASFATVSAPITAKFGTAGFKTLPAGTGQGGIILTASPGNAGKIYICSTAAAPDKTNYTNILSVLVAGQSWTDLNDGPTTVDLSSVFIGADNGTDFAFGYIRF